jgi:hypothetical protein
MFDPVRAILCFDAMQAATRRSHAFAVADIAGGPFRDEEVRAYLRFCLARNAVEMLPERCTRHGRHVILYRTRAALAPLAPWPGADSGKARSMLVERLARRPRDRALFARQSHLWTAIRALRVFEIRTLAFHARTETVWISPIQALRYVRQLCAGGYLEHCTGGHYRLRAARNTGPFAILAFSGGLVDLNRLEAVALLAPQASGRAA